MRHNTIKITAIAAVLAMTASLASCDKTAPLQGDGSVVDMLSVASTIYVGSENAVDKNYYETSEDSDRIWTARDMVYNQLHKQVMLTKLSGINCVRLTLEDNGDSYIVHYTRYSADLQAAKVPSEISSPDYNVIASWVLEATLEGKTVVVCFDRETGIWHGYIVPDDNGR